MTKGSNGRISARETHRTTDDVSMGLEPVGFTGKEADEEVGLVYFGERYLIPRLARWASVDPLSVHALGGGEPMNGYHYVSGSLLQARDPLGLAAAGAQTAPGEPPPPKGPATGGSTADEYFQRTGDIDGWLTRAAKELRAIERSLEEYRLNHEQPSSVLAGSEMRNPDDRAAQDEVDQARLESLRRLQAAERLVGRVRSGSASRRERRRYLAIAREELGLSRDEAIDQIKMVENYLGLARQNLLYEGSQYVSETNLAEVDRHHLLTPREYQSVQRTFDGASAADRERTALHVPERFGGNDRNLIFALGLGSGLVRTTIHEAFHSLEGVEHPDGGSMVRHPISGRSETPEPPLQNAYRWSNFVMRMTDR